MAASSPPSFLSQPALIPHPSAFATIPAPDLCPLISAFSFFSTSFSDWLEKRDVNASDPLLLQQQLHRESRLRSKALARRRQAPQQHGRGRVQARRPRLFLS
jgi:hypothetical protein